jgi:UDP-glucose 4-epimerase
MVTGVAGFIGSNLASKLIASGYQVVGVDNLSGGTLENVPSDVQFHQADIRSREIYPLFSGSAAVFHLAAMTNLPACLKDPVAASDVNVTGTVNVLEAARQAKVGKVIYADTSAEYEGIDELPAKVSRVRPISAYAVSKHGGALFCEIYERYFQLNITVVRYFNVYGPAQDWRRVFPPVVSSFTTKLLRGERPTIYGSGKKRRDFIYVDDVNDLHLLILRDDRTTGKILNVGTGTSFSVLEIFELIKGKLRTELTPQFEPDMPGEAEATLADISEGLELGWRPRVSIDEGLERCIEYYGSKILRKEAAAGWR